jgi:hypothetical protein
MRFQKSEGEKSSLADPMKAKAKSKESGPLHVL